MTALTCRHGRTMPPGCPDCLGPDDWTLHNAGDELEPDAYTDGPADDDPPCPHCGQPYPWGAFCPDSCPPYAGTGRYRGPSRYSTEYARGGDPGLFGGAY